MNPDTKRYLGLAVALVLIVAAILWIEDPTDPGSQVPEPPANLSEEAAQYPAAADFGGANAWLNTDEPVDLVEQRGSVVLVDFWTYSCINCINTFPHLRAWHDAYADDGLTIVGVHTPEFRFERDVDNVQEAIERYELDHPVALDNDYEIWDAYHNRFWPAKYLIGPEGRIRYTHFGEGAYDETETEIRRMLEAAGNPPDNPRVEVDSTRGGLAKGQTPELFAGDLDGRATSAIGNQEGYHPGDTITYRSPDEVDHDRIYLSGTWHNTHEYVEAREPNATVTVSFHAGGANLVANEVEDACASLRLDGDPLPEALAGPDVRYPDGTACLPLDAHRAYDFYSGPFERHTVTVTVPEGFQLYSLAFSEEGRER